MKNIPTFDTVCELFEKKPNVWKRVKPLLQLGLLLAPGVLIGSFGTFPMVLEALGNGLTLSDTVDLLESVLFPVTGRFRKKPNYSSPYDLPRLANTMVIFSAWFSVLEEKAPELWYNLELDEAGFRVMEEKCRAEYQKVQKLLGGDGRNILLPGGEGDRVLERLYSILKDRTRHLAQGLVATEHLPVEWEALPSLAVKKYHRHCEILQKYNDYHNWVDQQHKEQILKYLQKQKTPPPDEPGRLYLPAISSLLDRELFHGREDLLHTIETDFLRRNTVILSGLGGIGKTELAIAYGRRRPDPQRVYFLPFRTDFKETVAIGVLAGMAEYADQKLSVDDAYPIAMNRLRECNHEDLLILDNVDASLQSLNGVIREVGALPMQCLVTTRHETHGAIEVDKLPVEELLKIFDDYEAPVSPEDRLSLIHAVYRHTLTVSLIAATLSSGMVKAKTLLDALRNQNLEDILLPEIDAHYPGAEEQKKIYGHLRTVFRVTNMGDAAEKALCCATL
ncbi:MAG: hypothetical protein II272_06535, partial [Oscillospiraceae bacterium]|nr:hypothetical protein [Oscillospiraceae bacterium]